MGQKASFLWGCIPPGDFRGQSVLCIFQLLEAAHILWLLVLPHSGLCFCCYVSFSNSPSSFLSKHLCDYTGPTMVIQDNLPVS